MRSIALVFSFAAVLLCGACAQNGQLPAVTTAPPTAQLGALPAPLSPTNTTIGTDLQSASWNFDQAVSIGVLAASDPAPQCLHSFLKQIGLDPSQTAAPAGQSFQPKNDGLASLGAFLYIEASALKKQAAGLRVTPDCEAVVGHIVLLAGQAAAKGAAAFVPGLSALPALGLPQLTIQ